MFYFLFRMMIKNSSRKDHLISRLCYEFTAWHCRYVHCLFQQPCMVLGIECAKGIVCAPILIEEYIHVLLMLLTTSPKVSGSCGKISFFGLFLNWKCMQKNQFSFILKSFFNRVLVSVVIWKFIWQWQNWRWWKWLETDLKLTWN